MCVSDTHEDHTWLNFLNDTPPDSTAEEMLNHHGPQPSFSPLLDLRAPDDVVLCFLLRLTTVMTNVCDDLFNSIQVRRAERI